MRQQLTDIREQMKAEQIDFYLIVSDDFHASEYVGDYFKCREYVSGFDGSAGTLVITKDMAGLWTDGRYFIQAAQQLKNSGIDLYRSGEKDVPTVTEFLVEQLESGQCLGFDGRTVNADYVKTLQRKLIDHKKQITMKTNLDLVDRIWEDRPAMSAEPVWLLDKDYAGESREYKIGCVRQIMEKNHADFLLLSSLDDIAWLFNMRGNDIAYNPVAMAYAMIGLNGIVLYIEESAVGPNAQRIFEGVGIKVRPYHAVYEDMKHVPDKSTVMLDEHIVNFTLRRAISGQAYIMPAENPTMRMKAVKNQVEMQNVRIAHVRDGVAVTKLIYWLKQQENPGEITELMICKKLESLRKKGIHYEGQSFAPIAATGAHGAIVHYEPTVETDKHLVDNSFVLLDTGGQYLEGTTDITRTIAIGHLSNQQKTHYTAVLRGNLNLAAAKFKYGCTGVNFDYLARAPLWELGLDYNHGTGHGVGYLLNVHEGPNAFRWRERNGAAGTVFEEGMITSDEPGLYLEGKYGIRLENLLLCRDAYTTEYGRFMEFETLTLVPFDREAIDTTQMNSREITLLNAYHQRVYEAISPYLEDGEKRWLRDQTLAL